MGTIKRGILGGFSGKVANVVGSSWKGIAVIKSLPLSVANPRTAGQVLQRSKFSSCVDVAKSMLTTVIKPLWDRFAQQQSGYNAFISRNIANFNISGIVDPALLVISEGVIEAENITNVDYDSSNGEVTLQWLNGAGTGNKLANDVAFVALIDVSTNISYGFNTSVARSIQNVGLPGALPTGLTVGNLKGYLAFRRADGSQVSNSAFRQVSAA